MNRQRINKSSFKDLKICFVGSFSHEIPSQIAEVAQYFVKEGSKVIITTKTKFKFLKPLAITFSLVRNYDKFDWILIQSWSYVSFLYTILAVLIGKLLRKKIIIAYHGGALDSFLQEFYSWIIITILNTADKIVVPSCYMADVLKKYNIKSIVIPDIIAPENWIYRKRHFIRPSLLWVRHLRPEYDPEMAIRVFTLIEKEAADTSLTIVGGGPLEKTLKHKIHTAGLTKATMLGYIPHEEMSKTFDQHDILINTSKVDSFGVTLVEAMVSGLLVVTTDPGGIKSLADMGAPLFLVPRSSPLKMAKMVLQVLREPQQVVEEISEKGRNFALKLSWDRLRLQWLRLFYE